MSSALTDKVESFVRELERSKDSNIINAGLANEGKYRIDFLEQKSPHAHVQLGMRIKGAIGISPKYGKIDTQGLCTYTLYEGRQQVVIETHYEKILEQPKAPTQDDGLDFTMPPVGSKS